MDIFFIPDTIFHFATTESETPPTFEISDLAYGRALFQTIQSHERILTYPPLAEWLRDKLNDPSFGENYIVELLKATYNP